MSCFIVFVRLWSVIELRFSGFGAVVIQIIVFFGVLHCVEKLCFDVLEEHMSLHFQDGCVCFQLMMK